MRKGKRIAFSHEEGPINFDHINWSIVLYGILSLTVVRMIPVAISLMGTRLKWDSILFIGWFGPRGIASILFGLLILEKANISAREEIYLIISYLLGLR